MEEEKGGSQATRVINSSGLWGEPPTGPFHPFPQLFPPDTAWSRVALVIPIKDTDDFGGKTQGEVEILRETMGERQHMKQQLRSV